MVEHTVIEEFIDAVKQDPVKNNNVHSAEVSRIDNEGVIWVRVVGSENETPTASTSVEVKAGDAVNVEWRNNKLYIVGNHSNPAAGALRVNAVEAAAQIANQAASQAVADAGVAKSAASEARAIVDDLESDVISLGSRVSTAESNITTVEGNITSLGGRVTTAEGNITSLGGRVTTAEGKVTTIEGDITSLGNRVTTAEGDISTAEGNISDLQSRVTTAEGDINSVEGDITSLGTRVTTAEGKITTAEGNITSIGNRVTTAEGKITTAEGNITSLGSRITTAEGKVTTAEGNITNLQGRIADAEEDIGDVEAGLVRAQEDIQAAADSAEQAGEYAARALGNLSTVQNVSETLNWITAHGTMTLTSDVALDPTHVYFVRDNNGDYHVGSYYYSVVTDPNVADIATYYELSIDESLNNYVATHLAVDSEGLWIVPDSGGNRVLIATGGNGHTYDPAGTYVIGKANNVDTVLAKFLSSGAQIGAANSGNVWIDSDGIDIKNGATVHAEFSDQRIVLGKAPTQDGDRQWEFTRDYGIAKMFEVKGTEEFPEYEDYAGFYVGNRPQGGAAWLLGVHYGSYPYIAGDGSVGIGYFPQPTGNLSVAIGTVVAGGDYQTAIGRFNDNQNDTVFEIGNGDSPTSASNAFTVDWDGNIEAGGDVTDGDGNVLSDKADASSLATVATSGSYNDLSNKPTIPTVNNATLTIQKNGTNVETFTANASSNKTANITVPTKTSDITNDSGFIASPNVPYCTCATAAGTAAKTTTIVSGTFTEDDLVAGAQVLVKFTNANTVASPTLKIGSTTAKAIRRYGTTAPSTSAASSWNAGSVVLFIYDGTYWFMENWLNTTYSSMTDAEITAGTGTTARIITPARLKTAIETWADVNVQSDWNQADTTADDYIKNKPTIPQNIKDGTASGSLRTVNASSETSSYSLGTYAFAEGYITKASGSTGSHAEGHASTASGQTSHAEGYSATASGNQSHAEGYNTTANGNYSHSQNYRTTAGYESQTVIGKYNDNQSDTAFEIGNGTGDSSSARSNAFTVDWNGNVETSGDVISGTAKKNLAYTGEYITLYGNKTPGATDGSGLLTLVGQGSYVNCLPSGKYDTESSPLANDLYSQSAGVVTVKKAGRYRVDAHIYLYSGFTANDQITVYVMVDNTAATAHGVRTRATVTNPYKDLPVSCIVDVSANSTLHLGAVNQQAARGTIGLSGFTRMSVECLGIYE